MNDLIIYLLHLTCNPCHGVNLCVYNSKEVVKSASQEQPVVLHGCIGNHNN